MRTCTIEPLEAAMILQGMMVAKKTEWKKTKNPKRCDKLRRQHNSLALAIHLIQGECHPNDAVYLDSEI
jgi:hypothetical protein